MKRASIIIPVYNQVRYLPETVASALAQTYPAEVIVVDDGSSEDVRATLGADLQHVTLICQENHGLAAARNRGLRAAEGEYILFLDGDDLLDARMLATCIARLEADAASAAVYCGWRQISADGSIEYAQVRPAFCGDILEPLLLRRFFFFASGTVIRREALQKVGLFDESLRWGEDADLWLRAARLGCRFACEPLPLLIYRVHDQSMTARVSTEQVAGWQSVLEKFFADAELAPHIAAQRPWAYAVLHYETAGRFFRSGQFEPAREQLRLAADCVPDVAEDWFYDWLAGTAADPRTRQPLELITAVLDALPAQLERFRERRRRIVGRYHTAVAFSQYLSGHWRDARAHLWPAVVGDPAILANKGFLSLILKTVILRRKASL